MRRSIRNLLQEQFIEPVDENLEKRIVEILSHPRFDHDGFVGGKYEFYKNDAAKIIAAMVLEEREKEQ